VIFKDRYDAALLLITLLKKYKDEDGVVIAVPRGGVPLAYHIAKAFNFPLDIILTKKIGHPENSELAIGAVSLGGRIIDPRFNISINYIDSETSRIRKQLKERYDLFMGKKKPVELKNKTIILIDDGVATGNTLLASIPMIRLQEPKKIIIAVPVAPPETARKLKSMVDDFVCPYTPADFSGVGQFYADFSEVSDEEVIQLLDKANANHK
jgi:putative phosphoribosyl transferase